MLSSVLQSLGHVKTLAGGSLCLLCSTVCFDDSRIDGGPGSILQWLQLTWSYPIRYQMHLHNYNHRVLLTWNSERRQGFLLRLGRTEVIVWTSLCSGDVKDREMETGIEKPQHAVLRSLLVLTANPCPLSCGVTRGQEPPGPSPVWLQAAPPPLLSH